MYVPFELETPGDLAGALRALGGATTVTDLLQSPEIAEAAPSLVDSARLFAGLMVCNTATVAGNIACGSPAADLVPPLLSLDADITLASVAERIGKTTHRSALRAKYRGEYAVFGSNPLGLLDGLGAGMSSLAPWGMLRRSVGGGEPRSVAVRAHPGRPAARRLEAAKPGDRPSAPRTRTGGSMGKWHPSNACRMSGVGPDSVGMGPQAALHQGE